MGANSEADPHQDGATPQGNVDQSEVECPRDDKEAAATSVTDRPSSAANRGSTSSSSATRTSFTRMTRQSRERPPSAHEKSMREKEADRIREEVRETRRRKTMELMSQTGLDLRDLIADKENDTSPVEAMRAIMTRGKEKGWTTAKLFGVFLEEGSTQEKVGFEKFQSGLRLLGLEISDGDARAIFESFDTDKSGTIELSEFTHWCLDIPAVAWRAERVRRMVEGAGDVGDAAAAIAEEAAQAQVKPPPPATGLEPERPQHPLGAMIYEGSKLFWRSGDSLRIVMHENKDLHCITISTILEGGPEAFPELRVDRRLIPVTGEEDILNKVVELLEFEKPGPAAKEAIQGLTEEARANLFEKARAAVISEYLLARLKIIEGQAPAGNTTGDEAEAAAANAAARLENPEDPPKDGESCIKQENEAPLPRKKSCRNGGRSRANSRPEEPQAVSSSSTASVTQSGSIFPTRKPTPALVRLARDKDGEGDNGAGFLLLVDKPCFREAHKFAKRVSREDFERVEREVTQGLAEGHVVIATAERAQRRTHSSLNNQELTTHNAAAAIAKASEIFSPPRPSATAQPRSSDQERQTPSVDAKETGADVPAPATRASESEAIASSSALPSTEGSKRSSGPSRFAASTKSSAERHAHSQIARQRKSSTQKRSSRGNSFSGEGSSSMRLSGSSSSTDKSKRSSKEAQVANPSPSTTRKSRGSATTEAKQQPT